MTSRYDIYIRKRTQVLSLKLIPKGMLDFSHKIIGEVVQTRYNVILIDDDPLFTQTGNCAKIVKRRLKGSSFEHFEKDAKTSKDSCIYIDANLVDEFEVKISRKSSCIGIH